MSYKNEQYDLAGSITVEASITLPLYMLAVIAIISLMEMIKAYQDVEVNLYKSARELAYYSAGEEIADELLNGKDDNSIIGDMALTILADSYADNNMSDYLENAGQAKDVIVNGNKGISMIWSSVCFGNKSNNNKNHIIDLVATYELEPLCNIFGVEPYKMINRARVHAWTGYDSSENDLNSDEERIVYITDNGDVFHLSRSCTHIALSITDVSKDNVGEYRNNSGGKYTMCEKCGLYDLETDSLYITSEGDRYHTSLTCSGLKRSVKSIPLSEVGDKKACSRCGQ